MERATGRRLIGIAAVGAAFLVLGGGLAEAAFVLKMTDLNSGDQQIVIDQGVMGDASDSGLVATAPDLGSAYPGMVLYLGPVGSFHVVMTTGAGKPLIGTSFNKRLDMVSLTISGGEGELEIELTDTDFQFAGGGEVSLKSSIGGTTDGVITAQSFADTSNVEFGTEITSGLQGPFEAGLTGKAFSGFAATTFWLDAEQLFSISQRVTVEHFGGPDATSSFDIMTEVHGPEPSTLAIWGLGIVGVGLCSRRRRRSR
jgi:hypothetical protein